MGSIGLPLATLAGLASFLSPCVLPLVPAYVAYLGGAALAPASAAAGDGGGASRPRRHAVVRSGVAFVVGMSAVFIGFFYALRTVLAPMHDSAWLRYLSGAVVVVLALQIVHLVRVPWLMREFRVGKRAPDIGGVLGGFLLGASFGAGWTPCIGATLGAVLSTALVEGPSAYGLLLVTVYCIGLGVPFVATAAAMGSVAPVLRGLDRHRRAIDISSAVLLIVMAVLLVSDNLTTLNAYVARLLPDLLSGLSTL